MKKNLVFIVIAVFLLSSCKKDEDKVVELDQNKRYTFSVDFHGFWDKESHPTDYPSEAKFAEILLISHRSSNILFAEGGKAASWLKNYINTEKSAPFVSEYTEYKNNGKVDAVVANAGCTATGSTTFEFTTAGRYHKISLLSKLSPSPDWFIALNNIDLNPLQQSSGFTYIVPVYDAGIYSGNTYSQKGTETSVAISRKRNAPIAYPKGGISRLAIISINRIKVENIK